MSSASTVNLRGVALHGHMKGVTTLKFSVDGDMLFSSSRDTDCCACSWYSREGPHFGEMLGSYSTTETTGRSFDPAMVALDVNRQCTLMAAASAGEDTAIWSVETGKQLASMSRDMSSGSSVGFSHDDSLLMVASKGRSSTRSAIQLYNLTFNVPPIGQDIALPKTAFNPTFEYEADEGEVITCAAWGPTNDTIYFSEGGFIHILDVERGVVVRSKEVHPTYEINKFKFDNNYLTLATASTDNTAKLLDHRDLNIMQTYQSDVPVNDVSINPHSDHVILGGGMDAAAVTTQGGQTTFEVKFYHKVHGTQLGQLKCHFGTITAMSFFPDGNGFASASYDGLIKMYRFDEAYKRALGGKSIWTLEDFMENHPQE